MSPLKPLLMELKVISRPKPPVNTTPTWPFSKCSSLSGRAEFAAADVGFDFTPLKQDDQHISFGLQSLFICRIWSSLPYRRIVSKLNRFSEGKNALNDVPLKMWLICIGGDGGQTHQTLFFLLIFYFSLSFFMHNRCCSHFGADANLFNVTNAPKRMLFSQSEWVFLW